MFDFSKIKIKPGSITGFKPAATENQISELEKYCGHALPENYKTILRKYNGGHPEAIYFEIVDETTGIHFERKLTKFYYLDQNKESSENIWWHIKNYSDFMGPNTIPFADDGVQQIYYLKWVDDVPQVWFLAYLDLEQPENYLVMDSFDNLLDALYAAE